MYSILMPSGNLLEGAFDLQFELNNPVFSNSDLSVLPGSFSFPVTGKLTDQNKIELGNPHLVTNTRNYKKYEGVWVRLYEVPLFQGTLSISRADDKTVSFDIVAQPMKALKEKQMRELDLGGARSIGNQAAMLAHAKVTTVDPLDYDYVFAPVYNPAYLESPSADDRCRFQNFWNLSTDVFEVDDAYPALMPFPRIDYLLERIFAGVDFTFQNRFQTTDELRRLLAYTNTSMWTKDGLPESITLNNHVSKTRTNEWVKKLMSTFCLGLFTNVFNRTIRLVPLTDIIARPAKHDWTQYAIGGPAVENQTFAENIAYKTDDSDAVFSRYPPQTLPPLNYQGEIEKLEYLDTGFGGPYSPGIYFVRARHSYYYAPAPGASPYVMVYTMLGSAPGQGGEPLELTMPPLFDHQPIIISGVTDVWGSCIPFIETPGTVSYLDGADEVKQENDVPDRLLWYRGLQINPYGGDYPLCNSLPYDGLDELIDTFSLRIDGSRGVYANWWALWHQMLRDGKPAKWLFSLPVEAVTSFSFEDKVRVLNMDFLATRLRITRPLGRGLVLVEASLVSTI